MFTTLIKYVLYNVIKYYIRIRANFNFLTVIYFLLQCQQDNDCCHDNKHCTKIHLKKTHCENSNGKDCLDNWTSKGCTKKGSG